VKVALFYAYDPTQAGPTQDEIAAWLAFDQAVKDAGASHLAMTCLTHMVTSDWQKHCQVSRIVERCAVTSYA